MRSICTLPHWSNVFENSGCDYSCINRVVLGSINGHLMAICGLHLMCSKAFFVYTSRISEK